MERIELPKSKIKQFLDYLKTSFRVAAPVNNDGVLEFKEIESPTRYNWRTRLLINRRKSIYSRRLRKY